MAFKIEWTELLRLPSPVGPEVTSVATASDGSVYVTGATSGGNDLFLSKYTSSGSKLWTQLLGTSEFDYVASATTASDGSVYIAGYTEGNLDGKANSGGEDAFLIKYNSNGSKLWTQLLGTTDNDYAYSATTDSDGFIYITGGTNSNLGGEANSGGNDAFLTKYSNNGSRLWTQLLGTAGNDYATSVATALDGSIYVAGYTEGSLGSKPNSGENDAFLTKYSNNGSRLWTQLLGTAGNDYATSVATALDGSIYITGFTAGNLDSKTNSGKEDVFLSKYSSDGAKAWTQLLGTSGSDVAVSVATASDGSIYVTGTTGGNLDDKTNSGGVDGFLTKYNSSGSRAWTELIGTSGFDGAFAVTTSIDSSVYVAGFTGGKQEGVLFSDGTDFLTKYNVTNDDFPSVTLAVSTASVAEDGATNLVYTFTRTGATTNSLTVNYGIGGTADSSDYTGATPGTGKTITFAAGSSTATLTIDPTADTTVESDETVALTLATGTGYTVVTTTAVTGKIANDDTSISSKSIEINGILLVSDQTYTNDSLTGKLLLKMGQNGLATDSTGKRLAGDIDPITGYRALNELPAGASYKWEFEINQNYLVGTSQYASGSNITTSRVVWAGNNGFAGDKLTSLNFTAVAYAYVDGLNLASAYSGGVSQPVLPVTRTAPFTFKGLDAGDYQSIGIAEYSEVSSNDNMPGLKAFEGGKFFYNGWVTDPFASNLI